MSRFELFAFANKLGLQLSLLSLEQEKTSSMLVIETIGLGLRGLDVSMVLLIFALSAILFSSSVRLDGLQLILSRPNIELFGAKNVGHATLFGIHGVETQFKLFGSFGARGASGRGAWRRRGRRPRCAT